MVPIFSLILFTIHHLHPLSPESDTWAAQYNTWLLIKLMPKGIVLSFLLSLTALQVFLKAIQLFLEQRSHDVGAAVFDKDDDLAVEFVTAAANLRSIAYGIPTQSLFAAKVHSVTLHKNKTNFVHQTHPFPMHIVFVCMPDITCDSCANSSFCADAWCHCFTCRQCTLFLIQVMLSHMQT